MKQARRWLLLAAALVLLPQAAFAQKKKPKPPPTGDAGGTTTAPAGAPAGAPGAPASADADADQPTPATPPAGAAGGDQAAAAGGDTGDICQITPDAPQCANTQINFGAEAKKALKSREIYAVQQLYVLKQHRFEINPYYGFTLNDQFVSHNGPGLMLNYYITGVLAVGINFNLYQGLNSESDFNFQNRRAARIAAPLNDYQLAGNVDFTYVPIYGKFASVGDFIFNYDAYVHGGMGLIRTEPIAVIDPDNRNFGQLGWNNLIDFDFAIGLRVFFTRWLAAVLEVRDMIFSDKIENIHVATGASTLPANDPNSPLNPTGNTPWYDTGTHITNNVQLQIGLSMFLPTSFEYTLPK
jgi:outer membrane beta-barrel protein